MPLNNWNSKLEDNQYLDITNLHKLHYRLILLFNNMAKLTNKIEAHDRSVNDVLDDNKYMVDYFQREYKWEERHVEQLVSDLAAAFIQENRPQHHRREVENYNCYFLGPFVVSIKEGKRSIIDGQQRLTTITLFLIYLNNLQKQLNQNERLEPLIFSEKYGEKSFNIQVDERNHCMESLFVTGEYQPREDDDESTINMSRRYEDIDKAFPEELKDDSLPFFIDWLKYNVILVEIIAYSDENAYTIFETMNDRGLNLTPTEMLKSFILSRFSDAKLRDKSNQVWKEPIQELHVYSKDEDLRFIQSWFRAQYAQTIRQAKVGSKNEDFEQISTRFHTWFRDNLIKIGLASENSDNFQRFINQDFKFFKNAYIQILEAEKNYRPSSNNIYYANLCGIATSLRHPLYMAPITLEDDTATVLDKMNIVARYIETFAVRRSVNFKKYSANSINYTMNSLVKEIRRKSAHDLKQILKRKIEEMNEGWDGMQTFHMHGQNHWFVRYLLSRITSFLEEQSGSNSTIDKFYRNLGGKQFEIEHIWSNSFNEHKDEFDQKGEFDRFRNQLGALILLPRGSNQSYSAKPYSEKLTHYIKENLLAQSLCELTYKNNPNFQKMIEKHGFPFRAHKEFKKQDVEERQRVYQKVCEAIWDMDYFSN